MEDLTLEQLYKFNKHQTPLTEELKNSLPKEVWLDVTDFVNSVEFIKRLVQPEEIRGFAKDRPKNKDYNDGRIEVDIVNPHILEDMDYFRERAIYFETHGKYTHLLPNPNPKSDYGLFWKEELHRWKYGLVRESDGEWISGELYFYWNYAPIWLVEKVKGGSNTSNKSKGERKRKFAKPWLGDYLFHHYVEQAKRNGKHGKMLKTRGIGASFKAASWSPRNMFVLPGSGNPNFHLASDKGFLSGDKGIWGKILDTLDWIGEHTPLPRLRVVDDTRNMYVQLGFKDEYGIRQGLLSSVFGISLKDAPQKARGIRGPLIHYEEDGLFPNLEEAWNINRKAVEDGDVAFGFQIAMGTGGTQGASFEGSEKLFYNGEAYNIYTIPNVFDKNAKGDTTCGFFWGSYLNRNGCYEENNGEPDVIKALIEICTDRFKVKYNSSDPNAITQKKAEECITPQEAIMRTEGTVFPVSDLKEYLESIMIKREAFVSEHYIGDLIRDSKGKVIWKPNADIYPLRSYDKDTGNKQGCVEIFQQPKTNQEGVIPRGRYIAGIDPIDADTGTSLFSCQIMDLFTDEIVAEYTGRPRLAEDAYEIAMRLLEYYNAECNYESNLKGLFNYFDKKNKLYLLCDTPQILRDMQYIKATNLYGNKSKGTNTNKEINKWGRVLQAQWMQERKYPDNQDDLRLKLHTLRGIAYIEECIKWNSDGNFDRVSAGNMLFILREDRHKMTLSAIENQNTKIKQLHDDIFFSKNYDKRFNKNAIKTKDILFN